MNNIPITVTGNATTEPQLRFTPSGAPVCNFRIASNERKFNKQTNSWEDGDSVYLGVSVWREQAQNVADTVTKGMRLIVTGTLYQKQYEKSDGTRGSSYEISNAEVAPSLLRATAVVTKNTANGQQRPQQGQQTQGDPWAQQNPQGDPWATQGQSRPPF